MNLTLRQLHIFEAVARHLSFTRAATELHLTQPAVSMQVKLLEEALGMALFERVSKRLKLTEAGRIMLKHSSLMRQHMEDVQIDIARLKGAEIGTLRLVVPGTANAFVTLFVAEFCARHAGIGFSLTIANRSGLLDHLSDNETDLVIMGEPPANLNLVGERFMDNPLVAIAPPDHPLTRSRHRVSLEKMMSHEFVVREEGSGTRIAMERFCNEQNVTLRTSMEVSSNESIKQAVAAGLGLGIVSLHTLELELSLQRLCVLKAEAFPIMRHWYLVRLQSKELSPVAAAFQEFVLSEATGLWPLAGDEHKSRLSASR